MGDGLFVVGGYTPALAGYFDPRLWRLDLTTWQWAVQPRSGEQAVAVAEAEGAGGEEGRRELCCVRRRNGKKQPLGPAWPGPLFALSTAAVVGRDVWFFGGCSPQPSARHPPMSNVRGALG